MIPAVPLLFPLFIFASLTSTLALPDPVPEHAEHVSPPVRGAQRWIAVHRLEEWTGKAYHKKYRRDPLLERQGQGPGVKMVEVTESSIDIPSSLGNMTQKCLTLVSDPSQSFCTTFLNGQNIGSDSGLGSTTDTSGANVSNGTTRGNVQKVAVDTATSQSSISASLVSSLSSGSLTTNATVLSTTLTSALSASLINATVTANTSTSATETPSSRPIMSSSISSSSLSSSFSVDIVVNAPTPSSSATSTTSTPDQPTNFIANSGSDSSSSTPSRTNSGQGTPLDSLSPSYQTSIVTGISTIPQPTTTTLSIDTASIIVVNDPTSAGSTATAAAAEVITSTTPIPGQKLQVLPIGLGIFGGLVVLTLLVVGYVLYERRKYKLQFRRRKDEEKANFATRGAQMGYTA